MPKPDEAKLGPSPLSTHRPLEEVGIHLKEQCSLHLSRMSSTSKVVRNSSQDGIAVRLTRSNRLLQSVTIMAFGKLENLALHLSS